MDSRSRGTSAVPDFTAQVESPDRNRVAQKGIPPSLEHSLWRSEYAAKGRTRNLKYVEDMRIVQVSKATQGSPGPQLIVAVGAFVKRGAVDMEDLLYYTAKVVDTADTQPYNVVYFHTDTQLPAIPDISWLSQLHSVLDPSHRGNLQVLPPPCDVLRTVLSLSKGPSMSCFW